MSSISPYALKNRKAKANCSVNLDILLPKQKIDLEKLEVEVEKTLIEHA